MKNKKPAKKWFFFNSVLDLILFPTDDTFFCEPYVVSEVFPQKTTSVSPENLLNRLKVKYILPSISWEQGNLVIMEIIIQMYGLLLWNVFSV